MASARNFSLPSQNTVVLAIGQALFTAAISVDLTLTGLTGYQLAPDKALATLPFALIAVAGAVVTLLASYLIERLGRQVSFVIGSTACAIGGAISVWSVLHGNFWTFCLGTAGVGIFQAFAGYYRLAAADAVSQESKAKAISFVLAGGVAAAFLGPLFAAWTKDVLPAMFAGSYLLVCALGVASAFLFALVFRDRGNDMSHMQDNEGQPRPLGVVFRQPISWAALANNVVGGAVMMLLMTAAPLAAVMSGHTIDDGAGMIQWHLVGMYAPSLFAGALIKRFGLARILMAGMALIAACTIIALSSLEVPAFYLALLCLGVGWNFMFVGGTTLLARSYLPVERAKIQGIAEMLRAGVTALTSLAAGPLLQWLGWKELNLLCLPLIVIAAVMTLHWIRSEKRAPRAMPAFS
ncbi:MFS transporter [Mesorhizobium shangrilense]|uniref:MFS transporter n=1 Tax=Mesorhizobium shangrilense TaxID=460060 RepID=A0ABV2DHC5_9HYPH